MINERPLIVLGGPLAASPLTAPGWAYESLNRFFVSHFRASRNSFSIPLEYKRAMTFPQRLFTFECDNRRWLCPTGQEAGQPAALSCLPRAA